MKEYIINKLKEMGFEQSKISKGIEATNCESLDQVMDWIINDCEKDDISRNFIEDDECQVIDESIVVDHSTETLASKEQQSQEIMIKKDFNEEEKEMEKKRLEERIKQRRVEREIQERIEEIEREKNRRKAGSEMFKMREEMERKEQIRLAQELRKRKIEKMQEKQEMLEQIKKDREAMKKNNETSLVSAQSSLQAQPATSSTLPISSVSSSNECRLKIRLPNNQVLSHNFNPKEQLAAVRLYVELNRNDLEEFSEDANHQFTFMFPPNTYYTEEDMSKTLFELGLCPSARLIVSNLKR